MLRGYRHTVTLGLFFTIPLDVMAAILVFFGFRDRLAVVLVIGILIVVVAAITFGVQVGRAQVHQARAARAAWERQHPEALR